MVTGVTCVGGGGVGSDDVGGTYVVGGGVGDTCVMSNLAW